MVDFLDLVARVTGTTVDQVRNDYAAAMDTAAAELAASSGQQLERRVVPAYLTGRCANGYARDAGRVVHAVDARTDEIERGGYLSAYRALCGATHGRRSAGWMQTPGPVTCAKCIKRSPAR